MDVILCAVLYSDIHATFKEFVRQQLPAIEAHISGRLVLIVPATEDAEQVDLPAAIPSLEYARRLKVEESDFPCLAFFAGTEGGHGTAFSLTYRAEAAEYVGDFYATITTAMTVRTSVGLEGEKDPNLIPSRRAEAIEELKRRNSLSKSAVQGKDILSSPTFGNLIAFARLFGWFVTRT